jgi:wobble nucleotide-excising tRNase
LFFGDNGSGKTTISRVIAKPQEHPSCTVDADPDTLFQVYNSDFVESAYRESSYPGVFTMGEKESAIEERIEALKVEISTRQDRSKNWRDQVANSQAEATEAKNKLADAAWAAKRKLAPELEEAFKGYNSNKQRMLLALLDVQRAEAELVERDLIDQAQVLFGPPPPKRANVPPLRVDLLNELERDLSWSRELVGKADVPIAVLIDRLQSSDWMRKGMALHALSGCCPFCQQTTPEGFKEQLDQLFDDSYNVAVEELGNRRDDYTREARVVEDALSAIPEELRSSCGLDLSLLTKALSENMAAMDRKVENPSQQVTITSTTGMLAQVNAAIDATNQETAEWNAQLDDRGNQAEQLKARVWQVLESRLSRELAQYKSENSSREKKINALQDKLQRDEHEIAQAAAELQELQSKLGTVDATVAKINTLLQRFGFNGFRLKVSDDQKHYELTRQNGDPVNRSLSEGEKTLVSFLYFYHLARGGLDEVDMGRNRVIVVDDPISSLDANVLFLVSTLVREMLGWATEDGKFVRQVIVLTHNAYFHKEVSFRRHGKLSYWMVTKRNGQTRVERCDTNPITSSYSLLWNTVRAARDKPTGVDHHVLANAMRRILENYFCFLGGSWEDQIRKHFEGDDLPVLRALIAWLHDGSHRVFDGLEIGPGHSVEQYLHVFKRIFEETSQGAHYRMMMGEDEVVIATRA